MHAAKTRGRGFTLVEVLVSVAILSILGTSLIVVLRGGVKTWRRGEARRESFEVGQVVLGQLREDLESTTVETKVPPGQGTVETFLVCDMDKLGRQRLALVRTIKGEAESPLTGAAGRYVGGTTRIDQRGDLRKLKEGSLRAPGGQAEVAWVLGTEDEETLYRGFRAPVGGKFTFFKGDSAFWLAPLAGSPKAGQDPPAGEAICRPMASRVAYLGFSFWTPYSNTWATDAPPVRWRKSGEKWSGSRDYWDSTRGVKFQKPEGDDPRIYDTFVDKASQEDPRDDVLPERVKIVLVVRESDGAESSTALSADLDANERAFAVLDPDRPPKEGGFLKIDREWIRYDECVGGRVHVVERGARGTQKARHKADADVLIGRTFELVVDLPCAREDWGDR